MKLLVVEDDNDQATSYADVINAANATLPPEESITLERVMTLEEALQSLKAEAFDGAIVDLKLSGQDAETQGNDVLREIVNVKRMPVFVYSAHTGDIDPALEASVFFKVFEKTGTSFQDLVDQMLTINRTGITRILGRGGVIEAQLTRVFWEHIAEAFHDLSQKGITEEQLLRYITGHLYEYLELGDTTGTLERYLPEEVYIKPSIKPDFFTGTFVKEGANDNLYIILTPSCDIAQKKAKRILLATVHPLEHDPIRGLKVDAESEIPDGLSADEKTKREDKKSSAKADLEKVIRNNYANRYYFLPKSRSFNGGLIDFQALETVALADMEARFEKVATVNNLFLKDIIARFAFYYSRQGAPDINFSVADL